MKISINKHTFVVLVLLLLSGCAARHVDVSQSQSAKAQVAEQQLELLQSWSVRGKLAVITAKERKSAFLAWQQHGDHITMTLSTVVGTTIAKLFYDGNMATLNADDQTWQDPSPSALIFQVTGWEVPVESLSLWMKGQVERKLVTEYFDNGLVKTLTAACEQCLPWNIRYNTYAEFVLDAPYTLPTSIRLEQSQTQTTLIMRIDAWKPFDV